MIGAGNYAQGVLLPQFKANSDVTLRAVCTATGVKAQKAAEKFGFGTCTTDWREVIADKSVNTVLIATRHDLHALIVCEALKAGKTVFCEKPLCLREEQTRRDHPHHRGDEERTVDGRVQPSVRAVRGEDARACRRRW